MKKSITSTGKDGASQTESRRTVTITLMRMAPEHLLSALFVDRPNRFLVKCRIGTEVVEAMMPNPGRLEELLLPEAILYISEDLTAAQYDKQLQTQKQARKTRFTVWAVEREGEPIFLHTHRTNRVAEFLLRNRMIPSLESAQVIRSEVRHGNSRFDFLMEDAKTRRGVSRKDAEAQEEVSRGGAEAREGNSDSCEEWEAEGAQGESRPEHQFFLEVKSVTLFGNGAALFPDAVTDRGRRHLLELAEIGEEAIKAGRPRPVVLFLAHSNRVNRFLPDYHTDLEFARTFLEVRDRVRLKAVSAGWNRSLELEKDIRELPIPWEFLSKEVADRGSYLLLLRLDQPNRVVVKRLGELEFAAGWYVYVGSAMKNLTQRMARHGRKRKRFHWHIDFLRDRATEVVTLPIRASSKQECTIARELGNVLDPHTTGFGCSDCSCPTHLYFSEPDPLSRRSFHVLLEKFRMPKP